MKIIITGGAGFIGCNFVRLMLSKYPEAEITVFDKLTYAGRMENLHGFNGQIEFVRGDICSAEEVEALGDCDLLFNFAAETHVDRSIEDAGVFVRTDVLGTYTLLEHALHHDIGRFIQVSTDEVYGSVPTGYSREHDPMCPSSPYSASKCGAEMLVKAYQTTYGLDAVITRSSNNFGPYQYPEKLIPVLILRALRDQHLPIYGNGQNIRDWIYVVDNCEGIAVAAEEGKSGEAYNIGGGNERTNLEIARAILAILHKPESLITYVADRPGHDQRYALDCSRMREIGWKPRYLFMDALRHTCRWYLENERWYAPLLMGHA
ncbi:dTDP-glucose 4,6-dehydratase [Methanofollis aquaemaris]|uniref:dTDP-glucose 4,6-dehydratase n=1 Tax=Methanofollis aquaemaris TaxID=126734 RepID=A0A8A3S7V7_9EURY|nr:dTDP-glucose 4,6-dehydratase [Methanofollis aquaemaris]QSZ68215.1 dTDP-glucose 4,6-dehydratase [Methanofollis aquaemaris]